MAEFTAQIAQPAQLFANPFAIEAPAYQRAYAWTSKEAGRLLEDIAAAAEEAEAREEDDYFLGAMLFIERDGAAARRSGWLRPGGVRILEVVDGFQRLTTLTILFCALRDVGIGSGAAERRLRAAIEAGERSRLTLVSPDEAFFAEHVRAPGATRRPAATANLSPAEKRILEVRDDVLATLSGFTPAQRLTFFNFLLDRCCVVLVTTTGIDRAHRMFTVLNATGKPLARSDVLKAALLGSVSPAAAAEARAIWQEAERQLGEQFDSLFSHIHAMHGRPTSRIISSILEISTAAGGAQAFIERRLRPAAIAFDDLRHARHSGSPHSAAVSHYLRYLGWNSFADWLPPAMLWLERDSDPAQLAWFLAALDRLAFGLRILGIGGNKRAHRFGRVVAAIRSGRDLRAADSPLAFPRAEQRTIQHNLRDLHARGPLVAKHLLARVADAMAGEARTLPPDDMTVEHVLPRKLSSDSQWRGWFPDPEEREHCTESLGNLVLVTKLQNDRAANLEFARKHAIYFAAGAPVAAVNEDLRGRDAWKAEHIKQREAEVLAEVERLWSFATPGVPDHFPDMDGASPARQRRRA